jgi:hypothetical protein
LKLIALGIWSVPLVLITTVSFTLAITIFNAGVSEQESKIESNAQVDQLVDKRLTRRGYRYNRVDNSVTTRNEMTPSVTTRKAHMGRRVHNSNFVTADYASNAMRLQVRNRIE